MVIVKTEKTKLTVPPVWKEVMTEEELVNYCIHMDPAKAAVLGDSSLCVTPLVTHIVMDGRLHKLSLKDGMWAAHEVRVSSERQRASANRAARQQTEKQTKKKARRSKTKVDGYSEEDQLVRGIRYHVLKGQAFKIYSDAGVTGEYPANRPHLIERCVQKKADRYKRVFEKVALDPVSASKRTPPEIESMGLYLQDRLEKIREFLITEDQIYAPTGQGLDEMKKRARRGRPRSKALFRMGFDQLWTDVEAGLVHEITASDSSRVARDADLETEFMQVLYRQKVRVHGVIEDMSHMDVGDPLGRGINYLLASVNEKKLEEQATGSMRGKLQKLEQGRPCGMLPWWLTTDDDDHAVVREGCAEIVQRIIDLATAGDGGKLIARKLRQECLKVEGEFLSDEMVTRLLMGDAIRGIAHHFGLEWHIYPNLIDDPQVLDDIHATRADRRNAIPGWGDPGGWHSYMLTGITRCSCGRAASRSLGPRNAMGRPLNYYRCTKPAKRLAGDDVHACINMDVLEAFIEELVSKNPSVLTGALSRSLGGEGSKERMARRAVLEEHIRSLTSVLEAKEAEARQEAEEAARRLRIAPESSRYSSFIDEAIRGMLEAQMSELDTLKRELHSTSSDCSKDRQNERFNAALAQLGGWANLDVLTRNRLLCSIFETITLYSRQAGGKAVIKLVGVETPLPPVWFEYKSRSALSLPSVGEWIESGFNPREESGSRIILNARTLKPFYRYMRGLTGNKEAAEFARLMSDDPQFPRRTSCKKTVANRLKEIGATDTLLRKFEETWRAYTADERARIKRKLAGSLPTQEPEHVVSGDVLQ